MELRERYGWENALLRGFFEGVEIGERRLWGGLPDANVTIDGTMGGGSNATPSSTTDNSPSSTGNASSVSETPSEIQLAALSQYGPNYLQSQISLRDETISQLRYQMELLRSELAKVQDAQQQSVRTANNAQSISESSNQSSSSNANQNSSSQASTPAYAPDLIQSKLLQNQHATPLTDKDLLLLNHLIKNYLEEREYTMSQVTFSDEAQFGSKNVHELMSALGGGAGLTSPQMTSTTSTNSLSQQFTLQDILLNWKTERSNEEKQQQNKEWNTKLSQRDAKIEELQQKLLEAENKNLRAEEKHLKLEGKSKSMFQKIQQLEQQLKEAEREPATSPTSPLLLEQMDISGEVDQSSADDLGASAAETLADTKNLAHQYSQAVKMMDSLSQNIPTLMLGTKTKYKALLVPFIVSVFENSLSAGVRSTMVNTLLDMNKKPTTKQQRQSIINNIQVLVEKLDEAQFAKEVLSVLGERLEKDNNLHETQLLMFCEMIGSLGNVLSSETVNQHLFPLLVKIHQNCTEGGAESLGSKSTESSRNTVVRKEICPTLATLLPHFDAQRYNKIELILLESLQNDIVSAAAQEFLVTPFVDWCQSHNLMFSLFLPSFLRYLKEYLMEYKTRILSMVLRTYKASLTHVGFYLDSIPEEDMRDVLEEMNLLDGESTLDKKEEIDVSDEVTSKSGESEEGPSVLDDIYDEQELAKHQRDTPAKHQSLSSHASNIRFILNQLLPQMLAILCELDSTVEGLVREIYAFFGELSERSGPLMKRAIAQRFLQIVRRDYAIPQLKDKSASTKSTRHNALACYLCGPLAFDSNDKKSFAHFITATLLDIVHQQHGWRRKDMSLLIFALKNACKLRKLEKRVLNVIWSLIVHDETTVRVVVCELFVGIMSVFDEETIGSRVLPCFITLGNDSEPEVRMYALEGLSEVVKQVGEVKDLDKIAMAFDHHFESKDTSKRALQVLTNIIPQSDKNFREGYILKKLFQIARENNANEDDMEREHLVSLLLAAYKALNGVTLTKTNLREWIIPGLEMIEKAATRMSDKMAHQEISRMLRDLRGLVPKNETKSPASKLFGGISRNKGGNK